MNRPHPLVRIALPVLLLFCFCAASRTLAAGTPDPAPVEVLVLGTYHMGNPGRDLHNLEADDVTSPQRQAELAEVARRLARFRPTKIALEYAVDAPDREVQAYRSFQPAALAGAHDERVQIGFRLARALGHEAVYGIDEQSETVDYFPYDRVRTFAAREHREAELARSERAGEAFVAAMAERQRTATVGEMLAWLNDPAALTRDHRTGYLSLVPLGTGGEFPGAELNAMWYLRNAKIFAKLAAITRPGDRVLVVFGAGHAYWLRELARGVPGFRLVDANDYLARR
jgi:hypothetical protein